MGDFFSKFQKEMTPRQYLSLNTWEKWHQFRRPPWKFLFNVLLVIATTAAIIIRTENDAPYSRANIQSWQDLLTPDPSSGYTGAVLQYGYFKTFYLYRLSALSASVQQHTDLYYGIQNTSVSSYSYLYTHPPKPDPVVMRIRNYTAGLQIFDLDASFDDNVGTHFYNLRGPDDLGPFSQLNEADLRTFVHTLKDLTIYFKLKNYELHSSVRVCYTWSITSHYALDVRGRVALTIETDKDLCPEEAEVPWYDRTLRSQIVLYIGIIVLSFISQILHMRSVIRSILIFSKVRKRSYIKHMKQDLQTENVVLDSHMSDELSWHQLSCKDKMRFFNLWIILSFISSVCNILGASMNLNTLVELTGDEFKRTQLYFTALGCLLAWVNLIQYFEEATTYYVLITTLKRGLPRVCRFLIGVIPVFLGFAMFGVAFFAPVSEQFSTLDKASVTLFALLNGDVIHDVFDELYPPHPVISRIYLYLFIALFIYAVLNIFIAIIEDAFFASKAFQQQQTSQQKDLNLDEVDPLALVDMAFNAMPAPRPGTPSGSTPSESRIITSDDALTPFLAAEKGSQRGHHPMPESALTQWVRQAHDTFSDDFKQLLEDVLAGTDISTLRPPHDEAFFPCTFNDCLYCETRVVLTKALTGAREDIQSIVARRQRQSAAV